MSNQNNKQIAKNTLFLYFRMLITMGVSLYTSRIVLNVLGIENFGIYNVVGGVVSMFAILNGSLAAASQRFLTFELGTGNFQRLKEVFSTTVTIHNLIALVVFILAETVGIWFLNSQMNITPNRIDAANWVFQCSVLTFIIDIISVPYNASIIAHEHMKTFAYVGIIEVVFKLLIVFLLPLFSFDKLKFYSLLILSVAIIIRLIYGFYCKYHFEECKYKFYWNKSLIKEVASFAGWNFIGASSYVLMTQGVNILLNLFYGVIVNAAQGIANQVQNAIGGFINNFMTALNPQITKSYALKNRDYMLNMVQQGARFSFYLMFFLSLPILIETQNILKLWIKIVPEYAVIFVRLSLIFAITQTLSNTLITAMLATGNIKKYQIIVGGLQMLNLPFSYIALKMGFSPQSTLVIAIFFSFVCLGARLWLLRELIGLSAKYYLRKVLGNVMLVSLLSLISPMIVFYIMNDCLLRLLVVCIVSFISTGTIFIFLGLSQEERLFMKKKVSEYINKMK
jgi:O-antigen/teichoic acid export membrane protein